MKHALSLLFVLLFVPLIAAVAEDEVSDPFEGVNRGIFWFNDKLDVNLLEPVSRGYDYVMPQFAKDGVSNFYENVRYPSYLFSDIVQLKFGQAAEHTGRFLINTTVGLGGLIDVAKHFGLERHYEDFGTALAHNDIGPGPYIVLPFLGPSNVRDGVGRIVDNFLDPIGWIAFSTADNSDATLITAGSTALNVINTRAGLIEAVEAAKEASVDYYLFMQSAYYQNRNGVIYDKSSDDIFAEDEEFGDEFDDDFGEDEDFGDEEELSAIEKDMRAQYAFQTSPTKTLDWYLQGAQ